MEENREDYTPEYEENPAPNPAKSIRGYRIVIIILAVVLAALSILYFNIHRQMQQDNELLQVDRDSIENNLTVLMGDFDNLQTTNDTISANLSIERGRADSLMGRLKKERSWNLTKIRQYEKEVGTLRTVMRSYLRQIDSLNTLNKQLITENVSFRKEISTISQRAEMAEEKATELDNKVKQGSVLNARGIRLVALNTRSKEVSRVKNADRLRTDFVLAANTLTSTGQKHLYLRITSPDGYVLATDPPMTFSCEGERLTCSATREVDYQNEDLNVSIYYNGRGFTAGKYTVQIYAEGRLIGSTEVAIR
ncbi:MAG: hypothetical protein RR330_02285 [Alistipes sp.]